MSEIKELNKNESNLEKKKNYWRAIKIGLILIGSISCILIFNGYLIIMGGAF